MENLHHNSTAKSRQAQWSIHLIPPSLLCPAIKILEWLLPWYYPVSRNICQFRPINTGSARTILQQQPFRPQSGHCRWLQKEETSGLFFFRSTCQRLLSWHEKLLRDLNKSFPSHLKRWFGAYLHGRQSKVLFRNATSSTRNVNTGIMQGAVNSPKLFNHCHVRGFHAYIKLVLAYLEEKGAWTLAK